MLNSAQQAFVDSQLARENIETAGIDIWASTETNDAGGARDVLPLYTALPTDGTPITVCTNSDFDSARVGNKLAERRYLRIDVATPGAYTVTINTQQPTTPPLPPDDPGDPSDQSDPDMRIWRDGIEIAEADSGVANSEVFTTPALLDETYVAELQEFRYLDPDTSPSFPEQVCFNVSMSLQL